LNCYARPSGGFPASLFLRDLRQGGSRSTSTQKRLHVRRIKNGTPATHPLTGSEMRALRKHQRASPGAPWAFVFVNERGAPLSAPGFSRMVELTCSGMPAAMRLPMRGMILVRYRLTLVIETFRTQRATQRWRKTASRAFAVHLHVFSPPWPPSSGGPFVIAQSPPTPVASLELTAQGAGSRSCAAGLNAQRTSAFKCARTIRGRPLRLSSAHSQSSFLSSATDCFRRPLIS
jgi:hypothetical protein